MIVYSEDFMINVFNLILKKENCYFKKFDIKIVPTRIENFSSIKNGRLYYNEY